ncbi:ubiquinone/menaquinone biosynthesis C-methylase UbiE [Labedella gwakjiensis]|uniref:Methyltransferase domain-containing protein n=1 Tax=Labedella gwakjiensis TaxID=390269 RepID=A0A2P8GRB9_9MICO|nr:methyltransferase domain-containing protein [Labedella gwakjiensis]PSL36516.1 ubiquinone/menaquinone biosynthesis C-methylase UbiE [Labedella gwakjiensis]RUQ85566.1 methyltransferase domain-containing protein [Labedella gwakjiensis]
MCPNLTPESWSDAHRYEPYLGRWSRLIAHDFIPWLDVPPGSRWAEVGCGTGALSDEIIQSAQPSSLWASDPSAAYLAYSRSRVTDPAADFSVGDAEHIDLPDSSVDVTVSGLVLNFVPDAAAALLEARRVTRPGGTVAGYIWDYSGEMAAIRYFWDTAILLDPVARRLHEGRRFATWMPDELARRFREADLENVVVEPIVIDMVFRDFDDYWQPILGEQGSAPTYLATLERASVDALREAVRSNVPTAPDGSVPMTARAWAVRGTVPEDSGPPGASAN